MTNPSVSMVLILLGGLTLPASADLRITRDHGGYLHEYKAKYARIRDSGERIIIDGICNGACTVLLGTVPLERMRVTPRAVLGFNQAFYDTRQGDGRILAADRRSLDDEPLRDGRTDVGLSRTGKELDQSPRRPSPRR